MARKSEVLEKTPRYLKALLQYDQVPESILPLRILGTGWSGQWAPSISSVSEPTLQSRLGADNAALDRGPIALRDRLLHLLRLGNVALAV